PLHVPETGPLHAARVPAVDRQHARDPDRRAVAETTNAASGAASKSIRARGSLVSAGRLFLGEVDLTGVALALAEDLEPRARVHLAAVLDRHEQLLVDAERLLVERDVRDDRLLSAFVVERLARAEQLLGAAAELVELDDVLDVIERSVQERREVDLPRPVLLVLVEVR